MSDTNEFNALGTVQTPMNAAIVPKSKRIKIDVHPTFIDGIYGGVDAAGGIMMFYYDRDDVPPDNTSPPATTNRVFVADLRMTLETFKNIARWMTEHVAAIEAAQQLLTQHGNGTAIQAPPDNLQKDGTSSDPMFH